MKFYFTGKPCKWGHCDLRLTANGMCEECRKQRRERNREEEAVYQREYRKANKERLAKNGKEYRANNKEKIKKQLRDWGERNKEHVKEWHREYRVKNKDTIDARVRKWKRENRETLRKRARDKHKENPQINRTIQRKWRESNRQRYRQQSREYMKERRKNDPNFKALEQMRKHLKRVSQRGGSGKKIRTPDVLGYSVIEYKEHIESLFLEGMSWDENNSFHVDHIYPISKFLQEGVQDPAIIHSLSNLAPMYPADNISKGDKTLEEWLDIKGEGSRECKIYSYLL